MEDRIGVYIKIINEFIERKINSKLKKYNLTFSQGKVIKYLKMKKNKIATQKEIEEHFHISHATISGIISRLENNHFIQVNRHQKNNIISLLPKSLESNDIIEGCIKELEDNMCDGISSKEKEIFIRQLHKIYTNLKGDMSID